MTFTSSTTSLLEQATTAYQQTVNLASAYLESRGIEPPAVGAARLGVVAEPQPGHEQMVGRLVIPYLSRAGVVALKFRCMADHECKENGHPKYTGLTGKGPRLYNVNAFFDDSTVIAITEGELDALVLSHYVDIPAVGCPGVSTWQPHFPRCFNGYDQVIVFADGDQPGQDMARKLCKELPQARPVFLPDGLDANSCYLLEGAAAMRKRAGL